MWAGNQPDLPSVHLFCASSRTDAQFCAPWNLERCPSGCYSSVLRESTRAASPRCKRAAVQADDGPVDAIKSKESLIQIFRPAPPDYRRVERKGSDFLKTICP